MRPDAQFRDAGTSVRGGGDWRERAACLHVTDKDIFFPPSVNDDGTRARQGEKAERERRAKAVCADCKVVVACLEDSLKKPEKWGIRGGLNPDERDAQFGRDCVVCGKWFMSRHHSKITCSKFCAEVRHNEQKMASQERRATA